MATFQVQNFSQGNAGNSTISGIANQFGVSQEALASANQGAFSNPGDLSSLQAGATLNIPGQETVITPESMQATDPLITEESSSVNNATADFNLNSLTRDQAETQRQAESQANQIANLTQMQELAGNPRSEEELRQEALTQTGVQERRQQEADLSSQLNSIVTSAKEQQLAQGGQGRGITTGIVSGKQEQIAKNAAIKALPISAQLAAAQGNLALAEQEYNTLFQIKSVDAENKYNRNKESLEQFMELASSQDKARLELISTQEDRKFEKAQANREGINEIILELSKAGADASVIAKVGDLDASNPDAIQEALSLAGSSLQTPSTQIVKLDNGSTILVDSKTGRTIKNFGGAKSTVGGVKGVPTAYNALINTTSSLESSVSGKDDVRVQMARYIAEEDYASAYNQVANTVGSNLTGEAKSKFANARIDIEIMKNFQTAIQDYADGGGNMNLLKGKAESISGKLGKVTDPVFKELAVALEREFQAYRNNMTGAAFTPAESREYEAVNPTGGKRIDLNLAVINGALKQLDGRVNGTIKSVVPQAADLQKILNIPANEAEAKKSVESIYLKANSGLQSVIENLFNEAYSNEKVIEYLTVTGQI